MFNVRWSTFSSATSTTTVKNTWMTLFKSSITITNDITLICFRIRNFRVQKVPQIQKEFFAVINFRKWSSWLFFFACSYLILKTTFQDLVLVVEFSPSWKIRRHNLSRINQKETFVYINFNKLTLHSQN